MDQISNVPQKQNEDPSSYFITDMDSGKESLKTRMQPFLDRFNYYAVRLWPYINRFLNEAFHFLVGVIRGIIKIAIDQIKNFKGE